MAEDDFVEEGYAADETGEWHLVAYPAQVDHTSPLCRRCLCGHAHGAVEQRIERTLPAKFRLLLSQPWASI